MAGKKFTTRELKTLRRQEARVKSLKVNPQTFGLKTSLEQENLSVIRSLEAKLNKA